MAQMTKYEKAKALLVASAPDKMLAFKLQDGNLHILYEHNDNQEVFILYENEVDKLAESFE
tara:strand:- start:31 stop:213 length:183 start_codon:yes stop_codon:yes gene_type:complete